MADKRSDGGSLWKRLAGHAVVAEIYALYLCCMKRREAGPDNVSNPC